MTIRNGLATIMLGSFLVAGAPAFGATQVNIGIQIGAPPQPRVVRVVPRRPGPEFVWIDGYWYPVARVYKWHDGYWTRPPYEGALWIPPHHDGRMFFVGYWEGNHGRYEHDHRYDHDRDRDFHGKKEKEKHGRGHGNR